MPSERRVSWIDRAKRQPVGPVLVQLGLQFLGVEGPEEEPGIERDD